MDTSTAANSVATRETGVYKKGKIYIAYTKNTAGGHFIEVSSGSFYFLPECVHKLAYSGVICSIIRLARRSFQAKLSRHRARRRLIA